MKHSPRNPTTSLDLYDANDDGVIDADELITAVMDHLNGHISRDALVRVYDLYLAGNSSAGTGQSEDSASTVPPCVAYDTDADGVERDEVIAAINAFVFDKAIPRDSVVAVIGCFVFPSPLPPAPTGLSEKKNDKTRDSISLEWDWRDGAYFYNVERREGYSGSWTVLSTTITSTEYKARGLSCGTTYGFRVSVRGDGQTYSTAFGPTSLILSASTSGCTPSGPSFDTKTIASQRYQAGEKIAVLTLPTATGGTGKLTYSVSPTIGNGLTFDSSTRTVSGTPNAAPKTVIYTYTATDKAGKNAQLSFTVTVFDIAVMVEGERLEEVHWGVLDHARATINVSITRPDGYQFRVGIPASTGFQINSRECTWPGEPPTSTKTLWSGWVLQDEGFDIVRCGLGSGNVVKIEVWIKLEEGGTPSLLYAREVIIEQAWHRDDNTVDYYVMGAGPNPDTTRANGVDQGATEGMFPSERSPNVPSDRTPSEALLLLANYEAAAKAWSDVPIPNYDLNLNRVYKDAGIDVLIAGYWDAERADGGRCKGIACDTSTGDYPHLVDERLRWIEDPPHWHDEELPRAWTTDFQEWTNRPFDYQYLPAVLMHEFGHTLGLAAAPEHTAGWEDVMSGRVRELKPCSPVTLKLLERCGLSTNDEKGASATYEHHPPHEEEHDEGL